MFRRKGHHAQAFTVIELLVVVAVIALLVAILMPSLQQARRHAKAVQCSANLHQIGLAVSNYLFESNGTYPPSYVYPRNKYGSWTPESQTNDHPFGYFHWSYFMYQGGKVGKGAFQCPDYESGGAPRTNPGRNSKDWEPGQVDQNGDSGGNELADKQAPRMAYVANAAIMPRNKFTTELSGGARVNIFVRENNIRRPGDTILATEYLNNWRALGIQEGGGVISKSHRPINPFFHVGGGLNEYTAPPQNPGFIYGLPSDQETYGLLPLKEVREKVNILDQSSGVSQVNAVGRHHPTVDPFFRERFGGSANFLFVDTHVENMTVLETLQKRKWGEAYYGISGNNRVMNMSPIATKGGN